MYGTTQSRFQNTASKKEDFGNTQGSFGTNPASLKGKLTTLEVFHSINEGNDQSSCR